jgi:hypothetical protein
LRRLYQDLLAARREWPALRNFEKRTTRLLPDAATGPVLELVRGSAAPDGQARILFNLSEQTQPLPYGPDSGQQILFSSELSRYCGNRKELRSVEHLLPSECVAIGPAAWRTFS